MVQDCINDAKKCDACQFHANFIHQPPNSSILQLHVGLLRHGGLMSLDQLRQSHLLTVPTFSQLLITSPNGQRNTIQRSKKGECCRLYQGTHYPIDIGYLGTSSPAMVSHFLTAFLLACVRSSSLPNTSLLCTTPANGLAKAFNKTLCNSFKNVVVKYKNGIGMKDLGRLFRHTKPHVKRQLNRPPLLWCMQLKLYCR